MYLGDFNVNQTVQIPIPSTNANGTPTALANGTLIIYKGNNVTEFNTGITFNVTFDSRPGVNAAFIDMSANTTLFSAGEDYMAVLPTGDVSVSVANMTVGHWSINNRAGTTLAHLAMLANINSTVTTINTNNPSGGGGGGGGVPVVTINVPFTHARVQPPSSATTLTALCAASPTNVTISSNATQLWLQADTAGTRIEVDGTTANATTSMLLSAGQQLVLKKGNLNSDWFTGISVIRDAANANLTVSVS